LSDRHTYTQMSDTAELHCVPKKRPPFLFLLFDRVIGKIKRWTFLGHGVYTTPLRWWSKLDQTGNFK